MVNTQVTHTVDVFDEELAKNVSVAQHCAENTLIVSFEGTSVELTAETAEALGLILINLVADMLGKKTLLPDLRNIGLQFE